MARRTRSALDITAVSARFEHVRQQRALVVDELRTMIAQAQKMLAEIGAEGARPAGGGAKKKRNLSAQGRANIVAATKRRWAKHRAAKGK